MESAGIPLIAVVGALAVGNAIAQRQAPLELTSTIEMPVGVMNAIWRPRGDQEGAEPKAIRRTPRRPMRASTTALRLRGSGWTIASCDPSGDHTGYVQLVRATRWSPLPSGRTTKTLVLRVVARTKAMCLPSGDHAG